MRMGGKGRRKVVVRVRVQGVAVVEWKWCMAGERRRWDENEEWEWKWERERERIESEKGMCGIVGMKKREKEGKADKEWKVTKKTECQMDLETGYVEWMWIVEEGWREEDVVRLEMKARRVWMMGEDGREIGDEENQW